MFPHLLGRENISLVYPWPRPFRAFDLSSRTAFYQTGIYLPTIKRAHCRQPQIGCLWRILIQEPDLELLYHSRPDLLGMCREVLHPHGQPPAVGDEGVAACAL